MPAGAGAQNENRGVLNICVLVAAVSLTPLRLSWAARPCSARRPTRY